MAVQVYRMGQPKFILNDPKDPLVFIRDFHHVDLRWIAIVSLQDIFEHRMVPFYVDGRIADSPFENAAARRVVESEANRQRAFWCEFRRGNGALDDRGKARFAIARGGEWGSAVSRVGVGRSALVGENSGGEEVFGFAALVGSFERGVEPVIAHGLVRFNDDIIALADSEKN